MDSALDGTIAGYTYGTPDVAPSPISLAELEALKTTVGFTSDDQTCLRLAGDVLKDQTRQIVEHWRSSIIAHIPNLARHSRSTDNEPLPGYLADSNQRFEQWILDTCLRPYDRAWLDYQQEIALRHTSQKKNLTDDVKSTPYVPLREVVGFVAVMNESILPYLAAKGDSPEVVQSMHKAWCKSLQLQIALWTRTYMEKAPHEW